MYSDKIFYNRLAELSEILELNLPLAGYSNDPETIHRVRVAIRRIRSILCLCGVPKSTQKNLKYIATLLGPLRDLEVEIDFITTSPLSSRTKKDLITKKTLIRERMRVEFINRGLTFEAPSFLKRIRKYIRGSTLDERDIFRGLLKISEEAAFHAERRQLHRLRISLKEIRYTLEALTLADEDYHSHIRDLRTYQDILGRIHDLVIWQGKSLLDPSMKEYSDLLWSSLNSEYSALEEVSADILTSLSGLLSTSLDRLGTSLPSWDFLRYPDSSEREASSYLLGQLLSPDPEHPLRIVCKTTTIFHTLEEYLPLKKKDLFILRCAAHLHDIGHSSLSRVEHHLESQRLITTSRALFLSPPEREMVATLARNHREKPEYEPCTLDEREMKILPYLTGILRCADGMEFESFEYIEEFSLRVDGDTLLFFFDPPSPELMTRFLKKSRYLSRVSGLKVRVLPLPVEDKKN